MSFTVFLGNLPVWVTADDIQSWLNAEGLVADAIKVIRNPETQESKGFAFIDAPNQEEMQAIIRRFDRAPLEGKLLRANPAQPPRSRGRPSLKSGASHTAGVNGNRRLIPRQRRVPSQPSSPKSFEFTPVFLTGGSKPGLGRRRFPSCGTPGPSPTSYQWIQHADRVCEPARSRIRGILHRVVIYSNARHKIIIC